MPVRPLTVGQVADIFGVHPTTVLDWAKNGKLRSFKTPGGHRRFDPADVAALKAANTKEQTEAVG